MLRKLHDAAFDSFAWLPFDATLNIKPGLSGFFGAVFVSLNGIRFAELNGFRAKVSWGVHSPYFERGMGSNAWAYYFERTQFDFHSSSLSIPICLPFRPGAHDFTPYDGMSVRHSVGRALRSWCQPKRIISSTVSQIADREFRGRPMLGLHIRLTDAAAGAEGRQTIGLNAFFDATDAWLADRSDGGIYLATDERRIIEAFKGRYGKRVGFQDCIRSQDGTSIHGHYDTGVAGDPYLKGREVLIDALLLAECDHLIRTNSRVTCFTLCWNLDLIYTDLEQQLLGLNPTPWLHD